MNNSQSIQSSAVLLFVILIGICTFTALSIPEDPIPLPSVPAETNVPSPKPRSQKKTWIAKRPRPQDAVNQVMSEIARRLEEKSTLVIWLFDTSATLKKRRELVADGIISTHKKFGSPKDETQPVLLSAIATYGDKTEIITPEPVEDVTQAVAAVRQIPSDHTGKENVFAAVKTVAEKWLPYRTELEYSVMIVIVTDERGDDVHLVEDVAADLIRYGIQVDCLGSASRFGRKTGYVEWQYEDGSIEELPVDQGPECVKSDRLRLPFWGERHANMKYERLSSGFGPYGLARLCEQTGGIYIVADTYGTQFDPEIMRHYAPDYRPIREYVLEVHGNQAKHALISACDQSRKAKLRRRPLEFRGKNLNDHSELRAVITEAQRPAAIFDAQIAELLTLLSQGEKERKEIADARWRASYDLAMGRLLAMRVRSLGYNIRLAEMKSDPKSFQKEKSNLWRLKPGDELDVGTENAKLAERAKVYLKRVIQDHPATPWAMLAERELSQPFGWQWVEDYDGTVIITR